MLHTLLQHYRRERRPLVALAAIGLLTAMIEAASLVALAPLLQAVAEGSDRYVGDVGPFEFDLSIEALSGIAAALIILTLVLTIAATYASARIVSAFQLRHRLEMVDAFLHAKWEVQDTNREGRLVAFSVEFVNQSSRGLQDFASLVRYAAGLLVFFSGAVLVSWRATALITVVSGLVFLLQGPIRRRAKQYFGEYLAYHVSISEELSTLETSARELTVYDVSDPAADQFRELSDRQRALRVRSDLLGALPSPLLRTAGLLVIVSLIASAAFNSSMEVAALGVVVLLLYRSLTYVQSLVAVHAKLVVLQPVLDQLEAELARYQAAQRQSGDVVVESAPALRLHDVSYRYPESETTVVEFASLHVEPGEVVGVVGPSGAGKSTLADLLVGLRRPHTGAVTLGETPLELISERSRAEMIALVPQAVSIIPGTIADNVRFHRDIDRSRVAEVIDQVGLADLVSGLAQGIDTQIGAGSRAVSGGQAQRIGIARAIAGAPSFVVLDEPTSALDGGSEEIITDLIGQLRGNVGVIVIAHRLSTLRYCDRVIVVENGRITGIDSLPNLREQNQYVKHAFEVGSLDWSEPQQAPAMSETAGDLHDETPSGVVTAAATGTTW